MGREEKTIRILAIDPSGAFKEGQGTTGWAVLDRRGKDVLLLHTGEIYAGHYDTPLDYWDAHCTLIESYDIDRVTFESYILYATKAKAQINSEMETCQLIGIIKHHCYRNNIPWEDRTAATVKPRWTDTILAHKGIVLNGMSGHIKDAIRHGMHCLYFGGGKI